MSTRHPTQEEMQALARRVFGRDKGEPLLVGQPMDDDLPAGTAQTPAVGRINFGSACLSGPTQLLDPAGCTVEQSRQGNTVSVVVRGTDREATARLALLGNLAAVASNLHNEGRHEEAATVEEARTALGDTP